MIMTYHNVYIVRHIIFIKLIIAYSPGRVVDEDGLAGAARLEARARLTMLYDNTTMTT